MKCPECGHKIKPDPVEWPVEGDFIQLKKAFDKDPIEVIHIKDNGSRLCMILRFNHSETAYFSDSVHKSYFWGKYEKHQAKAKTAQHQQD